MHSHNVNTRTLHAAQTAVDAEAQVALVGILRAVGQRYVTAPGAQPDVGGDLRGDVENVEEERAGDGQCATRRQPGAEHLQAHLPTARTSHSTLASTQRHPSTSEKAMCK